ncbi:hypothetical protein CM1200mP19_1580 [bacterium]|nr:MAG: hypothetical protein CM1200mP19_1580 [bacterium]
MIIHGHGNEIFDMATSYQYYYSCEGILSVYCNEEAEALWNGAPCPRRRCSQNKFCRDERGFLHGDWGNGYIGHQDFAYGVRGNRLGAIACPHPPRQAVRQHRCSCTGCA